MVVASQLSEFFLDINYILRSFTLSAEFAIVALVLTMVIISGEIDLSPAANMALSACLFAWAQQAGHAHAARYRRRASARASPWARSTASW